MTLAGEECCGHAAKVIDALKEVLELFEFDDATFRIEEDVLREGAPGHRCGARLLLEECVSRCRERMVRGTGVV